ncbi:MAG: peptidylprolyl isomerase, partial [Planctomycetaceae bacterium]|nr:peptidylprolyl isomerase [Planctomycetaceae bacterium]
MFGFRQFYSSLTRLMQGNRRRARKCRYAETLETRTLLSGNVSASILNGNLYLNGDSAANELEVVESNGDLVVSGLNSTTINNSTSFVLTSGGTTFGGMVFVGLGNGDDSLQINTGAELSSDVYVNDLFGRTSIGINGATIGGDLNIVTGKGDDLVSLDGATVGGSLRFFAGRGHNLLSISNSTIGGNLLMIADRGEDDVVIEDSTVGGNTWIDTGKKMDSLAFTNTTLSGDFYLNTGEHNDTVLFDGLMVGGRTDLWLWRGNDSLKIQGTNNFQGDFFAGGILGKFDALEVGEGSTFGGSRTQSNFELSTVDADLLSTQINNGALSRAAQERENLGGTPLAPLTLTLDTSTNTLQTLSGEEFTQQAAFTVTGTTFAGATVSADLGTNAFTTATTTADANGNYSFDVPLANSINDVTIQSVDKYGRSTTDSFSVRSIQGSIVEFTSNLGTFQVELFDDAAPISVANFKGYLERYANTIVHRSVKSNDLGGIDVVQGGGLILEGDNLVNISTDPEVVNEFSPDRPNVRGTISLARQESLDTATSQFFFNVADNEDLNGTDQSPMNVYAVFGRVIGTGMDVVDAIHSLPIVDLSSLYGLPSVPLTGFETLNQAISGTASVELGSVNVTGVGTAFASELGVGSPIRIGTFSSTVASITSDTELI